MKDNKYEYAADGCSKKYISQDMINSSDDLQNQRIHEKAFLMYHCALNQYIIHTQGIMNSVFVCQSDMLDYDK